MQFGMPTLVENRTLEENIALCKRLGLSFIELNMNFPEYQLNQLERVNALLKAANSAGIYYTIHLDENLDIANFNQLVSSAYLETVQRTIDVAKKLIDLRNRYGDVSQPLVLNMHMNHGIYITLPDQKVQMYERNFDTYKSSYLLFRKLCEKWIGSADIVISIENTDLFRDHEKKVIEQLLQSPAFCLTWDIGHSKAAGEKDRSFLETHQSKLCHFHIHDGTEAPPTNHLALGDGEIELEKRLQLAKKRNARCVLETKTTAALEKSVHWLKQRNYLQH